MDKKAFLENLTHELKPQQPWQPWRITLVWMSLALLLNGLVMVAVQGFRPHFFEDLLNHPLWTLQIALGLGVSFLCCLATLSLFVPGAKLPKFLKALGWLFGAALLTSIYFSFSFSTPRHGPLGARSFCLEEVFLYGFLGILSFQIVTRKIDFNIPGWQYTLIGVASGLVPAFLMDMACMYGPKHALIAHYGPILVLIPLAMTTSYLKRVFVK